jgi:hypothetical protein
VVAFFLEVLDEGAELVVVALELTGDGWAGLPPQIDIFASGAE